ncbi:MAG: ATP-dependent DNA helicase RecG, partial [Alphaproteobacteria bacterium]|nr:ATP-dependent DNA helicase RecG [Alphaproteobacteria bacterium]
MSQRPFVLDPLFRPLQVLRGVGPKYLKLYQRLIGGEKLLDLIFHRPVSVVKREKVDSIAQARKDQTVIIDLIIDHHTPPDRKSKPYRIRVRDVSGFMDLLFFNIHSNWIEQQYQIGRVLRICGKIEEFNGQKQIIHPEILESDNEELSEIIYPLTGGVTLKPLRKAILQALDQAPELPEWLDLVHQKRQGWPSWRESIIALHHPQSDCDCETFAAQASPALSRLAYDELLANQLTLQLVRLKQKKLRGRSLKGDGALRALLVPHLPWSLTGAQNRAIAEIDADMASPLRMLRLLQGDVGSGKTIVALLAMLNAVESGAQAALMVPTEILARQHARTIEEFLKPLNVRCVTITGRDKGKARAGLLAGIQDGRAQIVIGTHSLFQDQIEFAQLGLCVIDEQHRFGVHQRLSLSNKGTQCDVLVMTATPIPRTLELTAYGDMDVSRLNEKPPGRQKIDTRLIPREKLDDMMMRLKSRIAQDERVYWVCPLVEESEVLDLAAATQRFDVLREVFGDQVGLIHGRMKPAEKDKVMSDFADGTLKILVATTVIEVGVHVPQANIMVVEHAERFGLAQLHQLRGRVGR